MFYRLLFLTIFAQIFITSHSIPCMYKKFLLLATAIFVSVGFNASALSFRFDKPNAISAIYLGATDLTSIVLEEGEDIDLAKTLKNTKDPVTLRIVCKNDYCFDVIKVNGASEDKFHKPRVCRILDWEVTADSDLYYIYATTRCIKDERTASFTVNIDKEAWYNTIGSDYMMTSEVIPQGESQIDFIPGVETNFTFCTKSTHTPFVHSITHNGTMIPIDFYNLGTYKVTVDDGDVIDIVTNSPEKTDHVTIKSDPPTDNFILEASILERSPNGIDLYTPLDNYYDFNAPSGRAVKYFFNSNQYTCTGVVVNGYEYNGDAATYVGLLPITEDNTNIVFKLVPNETRNVKVTIDDINNVTVGAGHINATIPAVSGTQVLAVPTSGTVSFHATPQGRIESITINDQPLDDYLYSIGDDEAMIDYSLWSAENPSNADIDHIKVTTGPRLRDEKKVLRLYDCNESVKLRTMLYKKPYYFDLHDGENTVMLSSGEADYLTLFTNTDGLNPDAKVWVDGELAKSIMLPSDEVLDGQYTIPSNFGIVQIFGNPDNILSQHTLEVRTDFDVPSSITLSVDDAYNLDFYWNHTYSLFHGSICSVTIPQEQAANVTVNKKSLTPDASGKYTFPVNEDCLLTVNKAASDATDINDESTEGVTRYYNLQGMEISRPEHGLTIEVRDNKAVKHMIP